ncbi:MAG: transglutaminaseTgpA domain-containing protein [Prochlorotrichaceae cyanobacterium]|jgi:transglutaminase-like putative cysteine protease
MASSSPQRISPLLHPRQFFASLPKPIAEDSIALRGCTQALVIVGIIATTIAATDVADPIRSSFWAIPLSITGSFWSYFHRRDRNIAAKFLIAMGMLLALFVFLGALVRQDNDTRLILAELLIQLQALHCFDLPRRKDLGYSLVIGLILMGVAANISQTLTFAPFLVAFLAIALPVLVLDYRSRLGIPSLLGNTTQNSTTPASLLKTFPELAPRRLLGLLTLVLVLGLIIFALLPRLPGYQLRAFPVSAPIDVAGEFNNQIISNPGYVSNPESDEANDGTGGEEGDPNTVRGGGSSPTEGPGELDDSFYYGFNSTMNQNLRGTPLKPRLLMRVRSQAEGFWRVMAFDHYTGQGWEVSRNDDTQTLSRSFYSYRFRLPALERIGRHKEVVQTFTIVDRMPNLIPALYQPEDLYFPTREVAIDTEGGLRSPVTLADGTTYTVVSEVPYRDRSALQEASTEYPAVIRKSYLDVPEDVVEPIRERTEELLTNAPKPITNSYDKALFLAQALKQQYRLQGDLPFFEETEDLVSSFLFSYGGGYPDHFSTTLTIMLRSIGIPARLVVGFAPGDFNPFTGLYLVKNTDAYAMTEVFFPQYGWFAFDPIPGHEVVPPSLEESYAFSTLKKLWLWVAGWLPTPVRGIFNQVFLVLASVIGFFVGFVMELLSQRLTGIFILTILGIGLSFIGWLLWGVWQGWRYQRWLDRLPLMESLYQQFLHCLQEAGLPKHPAQTPLEYGQTLVEQLPTPLIEPSQQFISAYAGWRYGQREPDGLNVRLAVQQIKRYYRKSLWQQVRQMRLQ